MSGSDVTDFQAILTGLSYPCGSVDGYFGKNVDSAVKRFQRDKGLTVDGVVGPATRTKLFNGSPTTRKNYYAARKVVKEELDEGIDILITDGYRSVEEQKELFEKGKSPAAPGHSYHNYGLAIDFALVVDNKSSVAWEPFSTFTRVGEIGEANGFEWGGRWPKIVDGPHLQMTFGLSIEQLQNGKRP